jgi:CRP-like cAMP-binding protein
MTETTRLDYADLLARVELFTGVDRVALAQLAAHLEPIVLEDGATVFNQGDPGDALYLVAQGSLGALNNSE